MKKVFILILACSCGFVCAQANAPAPKVKEQEVVITADRGHFDGNTHQMFYIGNVLVTDNDKVQLRCGLLTVDLPPAGGHPTNIIAEADLVVTNVVIDLLDARGQTTHITANKAVYAYNVVTNQSLIVTNETVTFTGGNPLPKVENPQAVITAEPLVMHVADKTFDGEHYQMVLKHNSAISGGTNASPFNFLK